MLRKNRWLHNFHIAAGYRGTTDAVKLTIASSTAVGQTMLEDGKSLADATRDPF
jgi:hypothetical protein